jgi:pimeloyl-ACP methyl ester carboxylesterase
LLKPTKELLIVRGRDAGHFVYLDEPERFVRDMIAFMSK